MTASTAAASVSASRRQQVVQPGRQQGRVGERFGQGVGHGGAAIPSRRRGQKRPGRAVRPVQPRQQRRDVGRLHGGAAPDAQARRRVAVGRDVVRHALRIQQRRHRRPVPRRAGRSRWGSAAPDRPRGRPPRSAALDPGRDRREVGLRPGDQRRQAALPLRPAQPVQRVGHAQHGGRVDGVAAEQAGGDAEDLGQRPGGVYGLPAAPSRARRHREHAVRRLPAQRLLPGPGDHIQPVPRQRPSRRRRRSRRRSPGPPRAAARARRSGGRLTSCRSRRAPGRAPGRRRTGRGWRRTRRAGCAGRA